LIQVTLSGNQEPVRVDITDAALEEGAEVSCFFHGPCIISINTSFKSILLGMVVKSCTSRLSGVELGSLLVWNAAVGLTMKLCDNLNMPPTCSIWIRKLLTQSYPIQVPFFSRKKLTYYSKDW
jgi:hypothetical protein